MDDKIADRFKGDDFSVELFKRDLTCAVVHLLFCIAFFAMGVWEMGVYNILSSCFFLLLAGSLWFGKIKDINIVDNLNAAEFILHSILATWFTGFALGYQYILFTLAIPIVVRAKDVKYKLYNRIRTFLSIGLYIILLALIRYGIIRPKYEFSETISFVNTAIVIMLVFMLINSQIISNFNNFENHLMDYRDKELLAAQKLGDIQKKVINNIAAIIEERDASTGEHTERTTVYVEQICRELVKEGKYTDELTDDTIANIVQSAALHDIGKIKTPDIILNKPGKLTQEEFEVIKKHTIDGGDIIRRVFLDIDDKQYEEIAYEIARYHHEKWNGTGYPEGLKGTDIPLPARIMAVADVYDALVSERVYKHAFSKDESLDIIKKDSGSHFDPDVAEAFLTIQKETA